jgi:hypothetical protein
MTGDDVIFGADQAQGAGLRFATADRHHPHVRCKNRLGGYVIEKT